MRILLRQRKNEKLQLQKKRGRQRVLGSDVTTANVGLSFHSKGIKKARRPSISANIGRAMASCLSGRYSDRRINKGGCTEKGGTAVRGSEYLLIAYGSL